MEEIIKAILEEYFSDFKDYHLIVLAVFTVIIALFQIIQSIFVSRKIEQFKTELKKSELRFSIYNELQIKALSKIYPLLVEFQSKTTMINDLKSINPDGYKDNAMEWTLSYTKCLNEFAKEKYILPSKIKKSFSSMLDEFYEIWNFIYQEKKYNELFYIDHGGVLQLGADSEDLKEIQDNLKKYDRDGVMGKSLKNIGVLRKDIEEHFTNME